MSNTFATSNLVIKYITMHLWNHLVAAKTVYRAIGKEFVGSYETGGTVTIQKPLEFRVNDGATISSVTDMYRRSFTMSALTRKNVNFQFTSQELTLDFFKNRTQKEVIEPACAALANQIDYDVLQAYKYIPNQIGTPGTTPNSTRVPRQAAARLTYLGVPEEDRYLIMDPDMVTEISENMKGLLQPEMVKTAVSGINNKGKLNIRLAGFECYESQNIPRHTTGSAADASITKTGASSDEDTTLALGGCGSGGTILAGDIFTIDACYAVNPMSGVAYPFLRQWVAGAAGSTGVSGTADGAGDLSAQTAIPGTSPYQIRSGTSAAAVLPYQNVSALPQNSAAVTVAGAASTIYPISMAYHKNAIALATVPLQMPNTPAFKARQDWNGISLRITGNYDVKNDLEIYRVDVLYGVAVMEPLAGCRIIG